MTRAEILSEIKQAEEEAKKLVIQANEARTLKISEARAQSREIIKNAEEKASQYSVSEISRAREKVKNERELIIEKGLKAAEDVKGKARKNIPKANKFILTEFERAVNA